MREEDGLLWVETYGGPHVLMHEESAKTWRGGIGFNPSDFLTTTNYGRACTAVTGRYAASIEVAGREALVLGDEPGDRMVRQIASGQIVVHTPLARPASLTAEFRNALCVGERSAFGKAEETLEVRLEGGVFLLFDSVDWDVRPFEEALPIELGGGLYNVEVTHVTRCNGQDGYRLLSYWLHRVG